MNTQKIFNILLIIFACTSLINNIMYTIGLIETNSVYEGAAVVSFIVSVASAIGWGIFLILLVVDFKFVMGKIALLIGY